MGVVRWGDSNRGDGSRNTAVSRGARPYIKMQQLVRQCCTLLHLHDLAVFSANPRIFAPPCPRDECPIPCNRAQQRNTSKSLR